jgi:hypothetical protein
MSEGNLSDELEKCSKCGAELSSEAVDGVCVQCQIAGVEEKIPEPEPQIPNDAASPFGKFWKYARWGVIAVCLGVGVYYLLDARDLLADKKPIRNGSYNTDAVTDQCIQNLWKAAALMQSGKPIPKKLVCPACGKPYIVTVKEDETIVSCPDPAKHGCTTLTVNSKNHIPEVIK